MDHHSVSIDLKRVEMKVLALIILVVGSASARGSGPYLPSGWRPQGPAFMLPSEVQKPSPIVPLKDAPIQESEYSGSDFLREYGPPKVQEVSQDITQQGLPDVVTEQAFAEIEARFNKEEEIKENSDTGTTGEVTATEPLTTVEEKTTEIAESEPVAKGKSIIFETQTIVEKDVESTEKAEETDIANSNIVSALEEREENVVVKGEGVKNIAEALVNLENELKSQQVQTISEVTEAKTVQESSGSLQQAPEGFLEYGPPGFREYGPPKQEDLLRSSLVAAEQSIDATVENNETRRRRFSPKFKALSKTVARRRIH